MNGLQANPGNFWTKLGQGIFVVTGGTLTFFGISLYQGNEKFYRKMVMPAMQWVGAETAHNFAIKATKFKLMRGQIKPDPLSLKTEVWGQTFSNPVGVAAGFDKQGEAVDGLVKMGFGFVEVGSVTPEPQPGNPQPRVFRLVQDKAVINRFGFNSDGHETVYKRLDPKSRNAGILGINLGKNKTSPDAVGDYVKGVEKFGDVADYLVINVSSPNTPGLRDMQGRKQLEQLLDKVIEARDNLKVSPKPPLLVKIAPDLTDKDKTDIAAVINRKHCKVDGLIVSNTTITRPESLTSKHREETGGLSGQPLKQLSTSTVKDMYRLTSGKIPIIGVGGISSGADAYDKIRAGASLVQLYTALVYEGPPVVGKIKRELDSILRSEGYSSVSEAVGADHSLKK